MIWMSVRQCVSRDRPALKLAKDPASGMTRPCVHQHIPHQVDVDRVGRKPAEQVEVVGQSFHNVASPGKGTYLTLVEVAREGSVGFLLDGLFMSDSGETLRDQVAALREEFGASTAGYWRVTSDHLEQVVFDPAPDLESATASEFAKTTAKVSLDQIELGIVEAARSVRVVESRVSNDPNATGSGGWLRRFGSIRSVAVPLCDAGGSVIAVFAASLKDEQPTSQEIAERALATVPTWSTQK